MNAALTPRMADSHDERLRPNGEAMGYRSQLARGNFSRTKSSMPDDRVGYLKVLVMSLIREIEALEGNVTYLNNEEGNLQAEVQRFESELIRNALIRTGGRQRRAARLLGVKVTTLNAKIKRYQIQIDDDRSSFIDQTIHHRSRVEPSGEFREGNVIQT
jgi:DNA-binding protein Fis